MASDKMCDFIPSIKTRGSDQSTTIKFDYEWQIESVDLNSHYESPLFSPACKKKLKWYLKLHGTSEGMQLSVCLLPCDTTEMTMCFRINCLNFCKGIAKELTHSVISSSISSINITEYNFKPLLKTTDLFRNLYGSDAPFRMFVTCFVDLSIPAKSIGRKTLTCEHCCTMGVLLKDSRLSDVTFNVSNHEFFAHKAILSVHSRVFSAMFEHEMAENIENLVEVTDVHPTVFEEMLQYIYTGQVINIKGVAKELLIAAEKYELNGLKVMCTETLQSSLAIDNAADILIHAYMYNSGPLKVQAAKFIKTNLSAVMKTNGFREMTKSHPILMADILSAFTVDWQPYPGNCVSSLVSRSFDRSRRHKKA